MNRIAERINEKVDSLTLSREFNNYFNTITIDDDIKNQLKQLLANNQLFINIEKQFIQILKNKYINDFLILYPKYKQIFIDPNEQIKKCIDMFIMRLEKLYLNEYAQKEIQNNLKYPINSRVNNLTFSSQDPYFREAPIVVCREFLDNGKYKDHVLIGHPNEHHYKVMKDHPEIIDNCKDKYGNAIFACAYLYPDNIIYLSTQEQNTYSSINEVKEILSTQIPNIKGIFCVNYKQVNQNGKKINIKDFTNRLARRI